MQTDHSARAGHLASHTLKLYANPAIDQINLAIDILRVVQLALRAGDYIDNHDTEALSDVTYTTVELLSGARELLRDRGNEVEEGSANAS